MTGREDPLQLATRGSALARRQAAAVEETLARRHRPVELVEVETTGDEIRDELIHELGTTGAFVRTLDQRVLDGALDGSVHSMKDMPTDQPDNLVVAGVPERGPPGDVLVTPDGTALDDLPEDATVGTSSLRRQAQVLARRPDLQVAGLRGNVDTRVEKLLAPTLTREYTRRLDADESDDEGDDESDEERNDTQNDTAESDQTPEEWFDGLAEIERRALERDPEVEYDAICLAEAGLDRSGLLRHLDYQRLDPQSFVPAPAQGTIAVTALDGDIADAIHDSIDHPRTRVEVTVERTILNELGGGCVAPVGIYARLQGEVVATTVRVLARDGSEEVAASRDLPVERHGEAARDFAADLADEGAQELIERARRDDPDDPKRA